uniref:PLAC8 family protein n=1 Tax=Corethron hystrix TaxID=216773 RepID=A0A7S1BD89_9STRA|mmetsp:Transcript_22261/g.50971  ORF Transcript_22261/g.50971 Transcript_22261/m.50971 type:complete len:193 (+) Transcript_22261:192-770(+)
MCVYQRTFLKLNTHPSRPSSTFDHSSFFVSLLITSGLLGQVMSRVGLDTTANPTSPDVAKKTFCRIFTIFFAYFVTMAILDSTFPKKEVCEDEFCYSVFENESVTTSVNLLKFVVGLYFLIITCKTRKYIREKNQIPGNECEDLVCAWCCNCCTIGQMARHTADYDTEVDEFFTFDGLQEKPPEAEAVQIMA